MGSAAALAQLLRAALRAEEPRDVEQLLRRGADPNLVLPDGAAAIHLAAGAQHPRGLRCLGALLRRGGDPNARSAEALTPLHVAAAWGCGPGLELLLSRGADPGLRDQDGLRALDLAEQQGHWDCVRLLRALRTGTQNPAPTPKPEPRGLEANEVVADLSDAGEVAWDSTVLQTQLGGGDSSDGGLEAAQPPDRPVPLEAANQEGSPRLGDGSSNASFITAVEASGAEHSGPDSPPRAKSLPQTVQRLLPEVHSPEWVPGAQGASPRANPAPMGARQAELNACFQALTLVSADSDSSSTTSSTLNPTQNPPREPLGGAPDLHFLTDDQTSLDSDVAALWLTEDEEQSTVRKNPAPTCWCTPVPAASDLKLLRRPRVCGEPVTPSTRLHSRHGPEEAKAGPGPDFAGHSLELAKALRTGRIPDAQADEDSLAQQFARPDPTRRWREGVVKSSFTYLLLDPRETQDLPGRAFVLTPIERLRTFVRAIFYVGKGTRARPDAHLWEALGHHGRPGKQACPKVHRIRDIWASGRGVVSLHCFQHVIAVEAYTREACLVDALGSSRVPSLIKRQHGINPGICKRVAGNECRDSQTLTTRWTRWNPASHLQPY